MSEAKEFIQSHKRLGYISALGGFEIFGIRPGVDTYCYAISGAWTGNKKYHKLKVYWSKTDEYVICNGTRLHLSDFVDDVEK